MKLTKAEWQIMNALWVRHPATAREISERLGDEVGWAYTTIKTLLTRLVEKGVLSERKRANASVYGPLVTKLKARRSAVSALAEQAFEGAFGPLMHFLVEDQKLTPKQRKELAEALTKTNKSKGVKK